MNDAEALQSVVLARIRELRMYRRAIRTPELRFLFIFDAEYRTELRLLVKLVRQARKLAAATPDPMSAYGSFRDWTEAEQRIAAGNR